MPTPGPESSGRCRRCVLPRTFPGLDFDDTGLCHICQETPEPPEQERHRQSLRDAMDAAIEERRGLSQYDCVVAYSGGKDSTLTLKILVEEYELSCLAVTIDNGFMSDQARTNCATVTTALETDHVMFTPSPKFMQNMYRTSVVAEGVHAPAALTRASSICNSCITLINTYMVKTALEGRIPIIAGGYIAGQVPKDSAILDVNLISQQNMRRTSLRRYRSHFGPDAERYFNIDAQLIDSAPFDRIAVINPLLTRSISEDQIVEEIATLGWEKTKDTGRNSSNCLLNDLGIAVHMKSHGFHPYVMEISEQVRDGLLDRDKAIDKVEAIPSDEDVAEQAAKIELELEDRVHS